MRSIRRTLVRLRDREQGSLSAELVILAPIMLGFALFLIACGRISLATITVQDAANAAARNASLSRTVSTATSNATNAANGSITLAGLECVNLQISVDPSGLTSPLGTIGNVTTTVTCTLNLSDIALPGLPGTYTVTATGTSPVDPYRERP
jgi:Flp pilus assembly protein TadG